MIHRNKKAFALVELLVVIAIIAVLVSILLPALSLAQEQARFVICGTKMRQIGLSQVAFSSDNQGRITPGDWMGGTLLTAARSASRSPKGEVNLGHLVAGKYLPLPTAASEYSLWCPTARRDLRQFTIGSSQYPVFSTEYFMEVWDVRDTIAGGIESNLFIAYDFRDSLDGEVGLDIYNADYTSPQGAQLDEVANQALVMEDIGFTITGGALDGDWSWHRSSKKGTKYNILMGDGSVQVLDDPANSVIAAWFVQELNFQGFNYVLEREPRAKTVHPRSRSMVATWRDSEFFDLIDQYFGRPAWPVQNE